MIKSVDESGSINYCVCTVFVSCTVMYSFLVKIYTFVLFGKYHNVHQLLFRTRCFAHRKFSMLDGSPVDIHQRRNEGAKILGRRITTGGAE